MSTLKADTIVASDGTSPVTLTKQSPAKAWVGTLDSSGVAGDSFNFTSFTDNGNNNTATFTNAMTAEYAVVTCAENDTAAARYSMVFSRGASSFNLICYSGSTVSGVDHGAIVHGDLA